MKMMSIDFTRMAGRSGMLKDCRLCSMFAVGAAVVSAGPTERIKAEKCVKSTIRNLNPSGQARTHRCTNNARKRWKNTATIKIVSFKPNKIDDSALSFGNFAFLVAHRPYKLHKKKEYVFSIFKDSSCRERFHRWVLFGPSRTAASLDRVRNAK